MDSRRLVLWISAGILGFQGGTLVLDLIHCHLPANWSPPLDLTPYVGRKREEGGITTPIETPHILALVEAIPDGRWRMAFQLMAAYGLRPEELQHPRRSKRGRSPSRLGLHQGARTPLWLWAPGLILAPWCGLGQGCSGPAAAEGDLPLVVRCPGQGMWWLKNGMVWRGRSESDLPTARRSWGWSWGLRGWEPLPGQPFGRSFSNVPRRFQPRLIVKTQK